MSLTRFFARPSRAELDGYRDRQLRAMLEGGFGAGVDVRVELVDAIPQDPSGKRRLARSRVRSPYDELDWDALA